MAARTVTAGSEQWKHVARCAYDRRQELGRTAAEVAERAGRGLSLAVLSQVENARKDTYAERTILALCRGLDWTPDSIERILDGGKPVPLDHAGTGPRHDSATEDPHEADLAVKVADLWARLDTIKAALDEERREREALEERVATLEANGPPWASIVPDLADEGEAAVWAKTAWSELDRKRAIWEIRYGDTGTTSNDTEVA